MLADFEFSSAVHARQLTLNISPHNFKLMLAVGTMRLAYQTGLNDLVLKQWVHLLAASFDM